MESANEAERLLIKSDAESSKSQLLLTGLKSGMVALDAGGGAGFVTRIMSEIVGSTGETVLADLSNERLNAAREYNRDRKNIAYVQGPLEKIPIADESVDYVFCRFVFEYLKDPMTVMREFVRIAKPGGKIVVGDLDYNMMSHYPLSEKLEKQLFELMAKLEKMKAWDPYAGRKIYNHMARCRLAKINIHLLPHHLIYGKVNERDFINWSMKFDQMEELASKGLLDLSFDLRTFRAEFMIFFQDPQRLSYSPLLLVEGIKPR